MSIWFILLLWTIGAFLIYIVPSVKATEAYVIAQTEYNIKVIRTIIFLLVFFFWIGILSYLVIDRIYLSKRIKLLNEYTLEDQALDNAFAKWLDEQFSSEENTIPVYYDEDSDEASIRDEDYQEKLFQVRAKNIEQRMDPNKRWSIGPDGSLRKDR